MTRICLVRLLPPIQSAIFMRWAEKPVTCLNLVGFPADKLDPEILHGIVEGALSKITESGAVLAGGTYDR